jgi:Arc/MetJ family transcription regulator
MQIQVTIDDELLRKALQASGLPTAAAALEEGLRALIHLSKQSELEDLLAGSSTRVTYPSRH